MRITLFILQEAGSPSSRARRMQLFFNGAGRGHVELSYGMLFWAGDDIVGKVVYPPCRCPAQTSRDACQRWRSGVCASR